jgi:hypothetical protein
MAEDVEVGAQLCYRQQALLQRLCRDGRRRKRRDRLNGLGKSGADSWINEGRSGVGRQSLDPHVVLMTHATHWNSSVPSSFDTWR